MKLSKYLTVKNATLNNKSIIKLTFENKTVDNKTMIVFNQLTDNKLEVSLTKETIAKLYKFSKGMK